MNERIRELAVQSDLWKMLKEHSWEFGNCDPEKDCGSIEKFAELIVQECVGIVSKRKNQAIDDKWNVDEAMSMAAIDMEEHFGVES